MTVNISDLDALRIRTTDAATPSDCRAVKNHCRAWETNAFDRIATLRSRLEAEPDLRDDFNKDKKTVEDYKDILQGILNAADSRLQGDLSKSLRVIRKDVMVQAIAAFYLEKIAHKILFGEDHETAEVEVDACYIGTLATAPWNLTLNSPVDDDSMHLITKGAGTVLLLSLIKDAFFKGSSFLFLKPLEGSESFYAYLQMKLSKDETYYFLDLKLRISSIFMKNAPTFALDEEEAPLDMIT